MANEGDNEHPEESRARVYLEHLPEDLRNRIAPYFRFNEDAGNNNAIKKDDPELKRLAISRPVRPDDVEASRSSDKLPGLNPGLFVQKYSFSPSRLKEGGHKAHFLQAWATMANASVKSAAEAEVKRRERLLKAVHQKGLEVRPLEARVEWRLMIGVAHPHPLETNITLHPVYGFPVIPGSAVKGIARAYSILEIGDALGVYAPLLEGILKEGAKHEQNSLDFLAQLLEAPRPERPRRARQEALAARNKLLKNVIQKLPSGSGGREPIRWMSEKDIEDDFGREFRRVFGGTDTRGEVTFFEALPLAWNFELGGATPHYREYYEEGAPPGDWLDPVPLAFLALEAGTTFRFDLAGPAELVDRATGWLSGHLAGIGAGAKTSSGYGLMKDIHGGEKSGV